MNVADLQAIAAPLSEERPCGPDLDLEFDAEFMNFVAEVDGIIPTRYFGFDASTLPFQQYYQTIGDLLERTRDVRLLVPLAKLKILQSDLGGFAEALEGIARLLKERWADVHPQPTDFLDLRIGQLSTLDDMPNVVLPLQHTPIVRSRRVGPITLRRWQVAKGEVNPREGEDTIDAGTLSSALTDADAEEIAKAREKLVRARDAVATIVSVCIQEAGYEHTPQLERLPGALEATIRMIDGAIAPDQAETEPDDAQPGQAETGEPVAGTVVTRLPTGPIASREDALDAMRGAARYFVLHEPSSPVPMLLREAQAASTKTFFELINDLVPDSADSAVIALGNEPWFEVQISTLEARNPIGNDAEVEDAAGEDETLIEDASDGGGDEPAEEHEPAGDEGEAEDPVSGHTDQPREDRRTRPQAVNPSGSKFVPSSRQEAVALLEKVRAYYRVAEPTSPVPLLVERAIDLSSRSFIELLGRVLPEGTLRERSREE